MEIEFSYYIRNNRPDMRFTLFVSSVILPLFISLSRLGIN